MASEKVCCVGLQTTVLIQKTTEQIKSDHLPFGWWMQWASYRSFTIWVMNGMGIDNSFTEIGPDFGEFGRKWMCGVLDNIGNIYCAPYDAEHILKIDTIQSTVETLDDIELPETGAGSSWNSGALGADNNIYYMPLHRAQNRIHH